MNMLLMLVAYFLLEMNINFAITIFAAINFILLYIPFCLKKWVMIKKGVFILFAFALVQLYAQNSNLPLSHTANLIY